MDDIVNSYGELLCEVDSWFRVCLERYPEHISCCCGCSECCRGLFDITLLDAIYLRRGFEMLPEEVKSVLKLRAKERLDRLSLVNGEFSEPWLLNGIPEHDWDELMPEDDDTPCLLLSESGQCLVYDHRPMTCRLNGIPLIDVSGDDFFDEWCTLNFTDIDPRHLVDIRFNFSELFLRELNLFQELIFNLADTRRNEVDMFIPAAVVMDLERVVSAINVLPERC